MQDRTTLVVLRVYIPLVAIALILAGVGLLFGKDNNWLEGPHGIGVIFTLVGAVSLCWAVYLGRSPDLGRVLFGAFLLLFTVVLAVLSVQVHGRAGLSGYVQAHGLRRTATVISAQNFADYVPKSGWTHTAQIKVSLAQPVEGQSVTTVHVAHQVSYRPGDKLTVTVDPVRAGYSELPGSPNTPTSTWAGWLVLTGVFGIGSVTIMVWYGRAYLRTRTRSAFPST